MLVVGDFIATAANVYLHLVRYLVHTTPGKISFHHTVSKMSSKKWQHSDSYFSKVLNICIIAIMYILIHLKFFAAFGTIFVHCRNGMLLFFNSLSHWKRVATMTLWDEKQNAKKRDLEKIFLVIIYTNNFTLFFLPPITLCERG